MYEVRTNGSVSLERSGLHSFTGDRLREHRVFHFIFLFVYCKLNRISGRELGIFPFIEIGGGPTLARHLGSGSELKAARAKLGCS